MTICACATSHDVSSRDVRMVCPRPNRLQRSVTSSYQRYSSQCRCSTRVLLNHRPARILAPVFLTTPLVKTRVSALQETDGFRTPLPNGTTTRTIKCLSLILKYSDSLPAGDWISNYVLQRLNWVYDVEWWGAVAIFRADSALCLNEQWKLIVSACGWSARTLCQTFPRHWRTVLQWEPIGSYDIFKFHICLTVHHWYK